MTITKSQIVDGLIRYVKSDVINKITDKPLKMIIAAAVSAIELNPALADTVLDNEMISSIIRRDGDWYDIDAAFDIIERTMSEYGEFPIVVPAIKFISPTEKTLSFGAGDVRRLREYIVGGAADV